jgi:sRNA-binding carbon storage regulator CsrA
MDLEIRGNQVQIGIDAPPWVKVLPEKPMTPIDAT